MEKSIAKTGKELVKAALNHREDKIPIDFGSTAVSGIHASVVEALRDRYGLEKRPVKVHEPYQMLGLVEDDLREAMGISTEGIFGRYTMFGFPLEGWKEFLTPWKQVVLVPKEFNTTQNEKGDLYLYPEGDLSSRPSGHMPFNGYFFDSIIRQDPDFEKDLDPELNLEEYTGIDAEDLTYFETAVREAGRDTNAIVATFGGTAIGDIALVPGPMLKDPKGIRDITEWYVSTLTRQDYLLRVFGKQVDIALGNLEKINSRAGSAVDVVFICGTDFGTQSSSFCSPETYRQLYHPFYKKINDWIHHNTKWKTFKHSCGAVGEFIPLFIESGFDILNPVQLSAAGMDAGELKKEFGKDIVFWGGGVDTQKTLPFGSPEEVRTEVLHRCEVLGKGGGFVFNSIHNIQAKSPIENVIAMIDAVHDFNGE